MRRKLYPIFLLLPLLFSSCNHIADDGQVVIQKGSIIYRGALKNGKYDGYGILYDGDSVIYAGQWREGMREGIGMVKDSLGREILGRWEKGILLKGLRKDSSTTYSGYFDKHFRPSGRGELIYADDSYYYGYWKEGAQDGFGFKLKPYQHLRVGEWKQGKFLGERLEYNENRIYGIDISRYQHGKGRKKHPIRWDKMRIVHLGHISKKRISGKVDYPVSFVYIKSTEGTTVYNPYYKADNDDAHRYRFHCGAYHFFSIHSDAASQARFFLKKTRFQKGDLPPVLDVEPSPSQIEKIGGPRELFRRVRVWLNIVGKQTGVKPILYVSQSFVNRHLPLAPDLSKNYNVWIARYGEYKPDIHLAIWQLSPDGRVAGIHGDVDINVFNGFSDSFLELETIP